MDRYCLGLRYIKRPCRLAGRLGFASDHSHRLKQSPCVWWFKSLTPFEVALLVGCRPDSSDCPSSILERVLPQVGTASVFGLLNGWLAGHLRSASDPTHQLR